MGKLRKSKVITKAIPCVEGPNKVFRVLMVLRVLEAYKVLMV